MSTPQNRVGQTLVHFRVDANPSIGAGHWARCVALASAFESLDCACRFFTAQSSALFSEDLPKPRGGINLERDPATAALSDKPDILVHDVYGEAPLVPTLGGGPLVIGFDDLSEGTQFAHIRIRPHEQPGQVSTDGRVVLLDGLEHAPLFLSHVQAPIRLDSTPDILINFGMTQDASLFCERVLRSIEAPQHTISVICGDQFHETLLQIAAERHLSVTCLSALPHAEFLAISKSARCVIGATGQSSLERLAIGSAAILMPISENQRRLALQITATEGAIVLDPAAPDFSTQFSFHLSSLLHDDDRNAALRRAANQACDGMGALRIAKAALKINAERKVALS